MSERQPTSPRAAAEGAVTVAIEPATTTFGPQEATLEFTVTDADSGVGAYKTTLQVGDVSVLEIVDVTLTREPGEQSVEIAADGSSVSMDVALFDNTYPTGDSTLAEITVAGQQAGTTTLGFDTVEIGDQNGVPYDVTEQTDSTVTISSLARTWDTPADLGGQFQNASPAVGTDYVYLGGLASTVERVQPGSGTVDETWHPDRAGALSDSSPVVDTDTVFVGSGGGVLYAYAPTTTQPKWTFEHDSALTSSPAVANGTVYVGANDGTVHAVDRSDGTAVWDEPANVGAAVYTDLATADGRVVLTTADGRVVALDTTDGSAVWDAQTSHAFEASSPTVANGRVYVAATDAYAFDAQTGEQRWQQATVGETAGASPAVDGTTVYVGGADGTVHALDDDSSGEAVWQTAIGDTVVADPVVVSQGIVASTRSGEIVLLDASGAELDRLALGDGVQAPLAAASGTVYVSTTSGTVAAVTLQTS